MAGSTSIGEAAENPVGINVTPMVDVIFCLCLFFMCSFHFKQLEGKVEAWLPKGHGVNPTPVTPVLEEIRIFMRWDPTRNATIRKVGNRPAVASDEDLMTEVLGMAAQFRTLGRTEFPVLIDATPDVPWREVMHVMDLCKLKQCERIEFTQPIEFQGQR